VDSSGSFDVTYHDVLITRLRDIQVGGSISRGGMGGTIDSIRGKSEALSDTEIMYETENPFYVTESLLSSFESFIEKHAKIMLSGKSSQIAKLSQDADELKKSAIKTAELVRRHLGLSDREIRNLWADEDVDFFRRRNEYLLTSLVNISELLKVYSEQASRQERNLVISADVLDHSENLDKLRFRAYSQIAGQIAVPVAAIAGTFFYYNDPNFHQWINDWMMQLTVYWQQIQGTVNSGPE
jgi:hypothetical protein